MARDDATDRDALQSAIARFPHAVLAFDSEHLLRPLNRAAEKFFVEENLSERLYNDDRTHPISQFLQEVLASKPAAGSRHATVVRLTGARRYEVEASQRSEKPASRWIMVMVRNLSEERRMDLAAFAKRHDLTARERDVVEHLIRGESSERICEGLDISHNTLKAHLKSIFGKTGSKTRAELLARILA